MVVCLFVVVVVCACVVYRWLVCWLIGCVLCCCMCVLSCLFLGGLAGCVCERRACLCIVIGA